MRPQGFPKLVYDALVKRGQATALELSRDVDAGVQKTAGALRKLKNKGLVTIVSKENRIITWGLL